MLVGVSPVFVFDGRRSSAKRANDTRRQAREKASNDLQAGRATLEKLQNEKSLAFWDTPPIPVVQLLRRPLTPGLPSMTTHG